VPGASRNASGTSDAPVKNKAFFGRRF